LELDPSHVNAAYARAACYNRIGDFARAIEDYNAALSKDRQNSVAASLTPKKHAVGSPGYRRTGSFAVGVKEYMRTREKALRQKFQGPCTPTRGDDVVRSKLSFKTPGPVQSSRLQDRRKRNPLTSVKNTQSSSNHRHGEKDFAIAPTPGTVRRAAALSLPATPLVGDAVQRHQILSSSSSSKSLLMTTTKKKSKKHKKRSAADVYHARGFAFRKKGDFKSAVLEYTKAIEANPKHFKAYFNRAFAYVVLFSLSLSLSLSHTHTHTLPPTLQLLNYSFTGMTNFADFVMPYRITQQHFESIVAIHMPCLIGVLCTIVQVTLQKLLRTLQRQSRLYPQMLIFFIIEHTL
jgi:tetratricopeptide (TPR) repeat protein